MNTTRLYFISIKRFIVYLATIFMTSCGSFQFSSYYSNDGIYSSERNITPNNKKNVSNNYYTQYFKNVAELGILDNNSESIIFTDVDSTTVFLRTKKKLFRMIFTKTLEMIHLKLK